jgi:hypothetical protein
MGGILDLALKFYFVKAHLQVENQPGFCQKPG